jgi:predicted PhzF superfamily epimerase YddE/YHI9
MELPIFQVDAFARRVFGGNPAAVIILEHSWLADDLLQAIAAENNLSETAFVIIGREPFALRWFTPKIEVDLCGHATLASAYVLLKHYFSSRNEVKLTTRSGELVVERKSDHLAMDFPARPGRRIPLSDEIGEALGKKPTEAYLARDLLTIFPSETDVAALHPNLDLVACIEALGIIASAKGEQVDFVSRFFAPRAGIPEDPVTGSSHCTLVPYWAAKLGKLSLSARQLSPRGGELNCEMRGDRVVIAGDAVEYLHGTITV